MIKQDYHLYSPADHETWQYLYNRQCNAVKQYAYSNFFPSVEKLGLNAGAIPDFKEMNANMLPLTGWQVYPVPGLIENAFFFEQMYQRRFGATRWMRAPEQIDYLEEPDLFHDVFGHVPLLLDKNIADFLYELACIAIKRLDDKWAVECIARLYWYTIEFGLVKESGELKIYGAGILSSVAETVYSLSDTPRHVPFDLETILETPIIKDKMQEVYFVLPDMPTLFHSVTRLEKYLEAGATVSS